MNRRKKDSTVREDRHGRGLGVRIANRLTTTVFACAATITLAIVALVNAGQVGAVTRWAGDGEFGAPYQTAVAYPADVGPESATVSLADGVLDVPELSHPLLPEGCDLVASTTGLGESTYATPPQEDHDCPPDVTVPKRDNFGCMLNFFGGDYRCRYEDTCKLERVYELSVSVTVGHGDLQIERTETEDMCGYGDCGDFNVAGVPE